MVKRIAVFLKKRAVIIGLTGIFWLVVFSIAPREFLDTGGDSAQYIILAESICAGDGYRAINYPGSPVFSYYPPVFPLVLFLIICTAGRAFFLMHLLTAFFGYISLFLCYRIFVRYRGHKEALFLVCICGTHWLFLRYSAQLILSEILYLCFTYTAFICAEKYRKSGSVVNRAGIYVLGAVIISYFTRYAGACTVAAVIVSLLVDKNARSLGKTLFLSVGFILAAGAWYSMGSQGPLPYLDSHMHQFFLVDPYRPDLGTVFMHPQALLSRFTEGICYYSSVISEVLCPYLKNPGSALFTVIRFSLFALVWWGFWSSWRRNKESPFHYFFIFYFLLIVAWPFHDGFRFILPVFPLLYFYFLRSAADISRFFIQKRMRTVVMIILSVLLVINVSVMPRTRPVRSSLPAAVAHFIKLHERARTIIEEKGVIASRKPTLTSFYTGHPSIVYPYTNDTRSIWNSFKENNVRYLIVDEFSISTYAYLIPFLYEYRTHMRLLARAGNTGLFEIMRQQGPERFPDTGGAQ